jgi:peptidoglycan/LPS O-acetylase OafA/YrhL
MDVNVNNKLASLVFLRAIAVLSVCCCHFAKPLTEGFIYSPIFSFINNYCRYGVEIFFVISGFVIPLSLENGKYHLNDYLRFLYKRLIRLHPAYLAAIALTLIITYFSFRFKHLPFPETFESIAGSILVFQNMSLNVVFWTLKIEAEFYIFIGLFFILLKQYPSIALYFVIPILLVASQFDYFNSIGLLKHLAYFLMGTIGFLIYTKKGHVWHHYLLLLAVIIFSFLFTSIPNMVDGVPATFAGIFTILFILFYKGKTPQSMNFIGKISYSLYLVHYPISKMMIRFLMKLLPAPIAWILFLIVFAIVIPVAWLFYKYIEAPSEKYSQAIRFKAFSQLP